MRDKLEKVGWWLHSVRGLYAHVQIYRAMRKAFRGVVRTDAARAQLRQQEAQVGNSFLHVILVHKVGSGRFF